MLLGRQAKQISIIQYLGFEPPRSRPAEEIFRREIYTTNHYYEYDYHYYHQYHQNGHCCHHHHCHHDGDDDDGEKEQYNVNDDGDCYWLRVRATTKVVII